jgi:hypothetical protein
LHPPVEGRLINGFEGVDVGQRLRVQSDPHGYGTRIYRL